MTVQKILPVCILLILLSGCRKQSQSIQPTVSDPTPTEVSSPSAVPVETINPSPAALSPLPSLKPRISLPPKTTTGTKSLEITELSTTWQSDDTRNVQSVDTIVLHSLYNPNVQDGLTIQAAQAVLEESEVSSHYIIDRDGKIYRLVPENRLAWHAGDSQMPAPDSRKKVNDFSIGVELIATQTSGITQAQYVAVVKLSLDIANRLPISAIVGHGDIAPGRKTDPWNFDWKKFEEGFTASSPKQIRFPTSI